MVQSGAASYVVLFLFHLIAEPFYAKTCPFISLVTPCCHRQMLVSFLLFSKQWLGSLVCFHWHQEVFLLFQYQGGRVYLKCDASQSFCLTVCIELKWSLSGLVRATSGCIWGFLPTLFLQGFYLVLLGVTRYSGLILYISCPATWPRRLGAENKNKNSRIWTHHKPAKRESLGSGADTVYCLSAPSQGGQPLG